MSGLSNAPVNANKLSVKEYLMKVYPPSVSNLEEAFYNEFWDNRNYEEAQELSNKIIDLFKEADMTYTDAYAMLGYIRKDLEYRSTQIRL